MCEDAELTKVRQIRQAEEHRWDEDAQNAVRSEMSYGALRSGRIRNPENDQMAKKTEYMIEADTKRSTSRGSYERQYDSYRQSEPRCTNTSNEARKRLTLEPHEPAPRHYARSDYPHAYEPSGSRSRYSPVPTIRPVFKSTVQPVTPPWPVDSEIAQRPLEQESRAQQLRIQLEQERARHAEIAYQAAAAHAKKVQEDARSFQRAEHWETHAFPHRSSLMRRGAGRPPLKSALKTPAQRSSSSISERASSSHGHNLEPDVEYESEKEERGRGYPGEMI
ncbi:hypothetical protein EYC80_000085 [Monilinia laxa]|uniref:Uncharacterized protein n=1 Tax=Monilinia laxa TaxID=61186 RepID=A0A5N6K9K3_MONLA|nr:hypothetical protein EYC80_000085 [Monilinia laxa]